MNDHIPAIEDLDGDIEQEKAYRLVAAIMKEELEKINGSFKIKPFVMDIAEKAKQKAGDILSEVMIRKAILDALKWNLKEKLLRKRDETTYCKGGQVPKFRDIDDDVTPYVQGTGELTRTVRILSTAEVVIMAEKALDELPYEFSTPKFAEALAKTLPAEIKRQLSEIFRVNDGVIIVHQILIQLSRRNLIESYWSSRSQRVDYSIEKEDFWVKINQPRPGKKPVKKQELRSLDDDWM